MDVVVCFLNDDTAELHTHGGNAVTSIIARQLQDSNWRELSMEEYQFTVEPNIWRAEVQTALSNATTVNSSLILLQQLERLPSEVRQIVSTLCEGEVADSKERLKKLASWSSFGFHLVHPWQVQKNHETTSSTLSQHSVS